MFRCPTFLFRNERIRYSQNVVPLQIGKLTYFFPYLRAEGFDFLGREFSGVKRIMQLLIGRLCQEISIPSPSEKMRP